MSCFDSIVSNEQSRNEVLCTTSCWLRGNLFICMFGTKITALAARDWS